MRSSKKLPAQVELLSKQQGVWPGQEERGAPTRRGNVLDEDCKMEVEKTDSKKKLDEQKKSILRQLRDIEKFASMDPVLRDRQKEIRKDELQENERKRTELPPEHQKMQKMSQKLQRLQDKQRYHFKSVGAHEEEMQLLDKEMEERKALSETRFWGLSEKSGNSRKAGAELGRRTRKAEAAVCRNPMDAASIQQYGIGSSPLEKRGQKYVEKRVP